MRRLIVSIGSSLRGDDAVAHQAVRLCQEAVPDAGIDFRAMHQLVPELACELMDVDSVVFVDADAAHDGPPSLQLLRESPPRQGAATVASASLDHSFVPERIVELARRLYGFRGEAWVCRIPVSAFELGEGLTGMALQSAAVAAVLLVRWVLAAQPRSAPSSAGQPAR